MLLETRFSDGTEVMLDCEAVSAIDKGETAGQAKPEDVLRRAMELGAGVARELAQAAQGAAAGKPTPAGIEAQFALRVDSNAVLSIARTPEEGQLRFTVRWGR
jgi:hypothetical protein